MTRLRRRTKGAWRTAFAIAGVASGIAAALGAAVFVSGAAAQSPQSCARRADILRHLGVNFDEAPVAIGLSDNGSLLEILASDGGRTWTLLFSLPSGVSCLMATGQDWQFVFAKPKGKGADAQRVAPEGKGA